MYIICIYTKIARERERESKIPICEGSIDFSWRLQIWRSNLFWWQCSQVYYSVNVPHCILWFSALLIVAVKVTSKISLNVCFDSLSGTSKPKALQHYFTASYRKLFEFAGLLGPPSHVDITQPIGVEGCTASTCKLQYTFTSPLKIISWTFFVFFSF